jgi:light-regulated signal transduction histidine kinase (bacteriophytochrome)
VQDQFGAALLRCEDEPIRVPGSVQQHGFFLLIDPVLETVLVASENVERFLKRPLKLIVGARLDAILGLELRLILESIRNSRQKEGQAAVTYLGSFRIGDDQFNVMTHPIGTMRALEFEQQERLVGAEMMNSIVTNFVATLGRLRNGQDLCDALTEQIAELTGFDRTMLYSFNEDGHGTVQSEVNHGRLPSYLGLRFPAPDIPRQARELYVLNTSRIIPDAWYTPSPLAGSTTRPAAQLDLSLSVLRSVSPIHLQYMKNMGTAASMSVSIVLDGALWGLVSCHNGSARTVPYLIRSACDMLAKLAATQLTTFRATAHVQEMVNFHNAQRELLTVLAGQQNYLVALLGQARGLLQITNAAGVAVLVDGRLVHEGKVPDEASIRRISEWLDEDEERGICSSGQLSKSLPWAESIRDVASGLLAVRISSVQGRYVMWFRPEVVSTVKWAGEPVKQQDAGRQLTPRASFDQWTEIVQGRSEPWTEMEVESATEFRAALTSIGLRRAEEELELGEARFQQLTQALPVKIFVADDIGELTYVNARWHESGLPETGLWFEQLRLPQEDAEMSTVRWQECIATGRTFEAEMRLGSSDGGQECWNFARVVPFSTRRGSTRRMDWHAGGFDRKQGARGGAAHGREACTYGSYDQRDRA